MDEKQEEKFQIKPEALIIKDEHVSDIAPEYPSAQFFPTTQTGNLLDTHRSDEEHFHKGCSNQTEGESSSIIKYPYECIHCGLRSTSTTSLILNDKQEYFCTHCLFSTKCTPYSKSYDFQSTHHCNLCDFKTSNKFSLSRHLRVHYGAKPHHCPQCDFNTSNILLLKQHNTLVHQNKIAHCCNQCHFKTTTSRNLKRHMCIHTGEKPHHCTHCDYKTADRSNLRKHIKSYCGENKRFQGHFLSHTTVRTPSSD